MELEAVVCNQCGAPLRIPLAVRFVCCAHCGSQLLVHREEGLLYTEKIDQLDQRTEQMATQLARLRYESALAQLDREWEEERKQYVAVDKSGNERKVRQLLGISIILAGFGSGMATLLSSHANAPPWLGVGEITVSIILARKLFLKASPAMEARARYLARRARLSVDDFLPGAEDLATLPRELDAASKRVQASTHGKRRSR
ncbi:MAG TPA: hypothetical protein VFE24_10500 [Pirellulales bacterium]|jgi:hypothetical protein|nr:hypothetical protein [Pirellulales bacterium]